MKVKRREGTHNREMFLGWEGRDKEGKVNKRLAVETAIGLDSCPPVGSIGLTPVGVGP